MKRLTRAKNIAVDLYDDKKEVWRVYEMLRRGEIKGFQSGSTWYVPVAGYEEWKRNRGIEGDQGEAS